MGTRKVERGPVSERVAENVRRIRTEGRLTLDDVARAMGDLGRPIHKSGLSKIESGERRVDADDLVALALALGVNASALLLPNVAGDEAVDLAPRVSAPAWAVWQWAEGFAPLPTRPADDEDDPYNTPDEVDAFRRASWPTSRRLEAEHPLMRAGSDLVARLRRVLAHASKPADDRVRQSVIGFARRAVDRVLRELEDFEEGSA